MKTEKVKVVIELEKAEGKYFYNNGHGIEEIPSDRIILEDKEPYTIEDMFAWGAIVKIQAIFYKKANAFKRRKLRKILLKTIIEH